MELLLNFNPFAVPVMLQSQTFAYVLDVFDYMVWWHKASAYMMPSLCIPFLHQNALCNVLTFHPKSHKTPFQTLACVTNIKANTFAFEWKVFRSHPYMFKTFYGDIKARSINFASKLLKCNIQKRSCSWQHFINIMDAIRRFCNLLLKKTLKCLLFIAGYNVYLTMTS